MDILKFNGYEGTAELDMDRRVCRGKILFIDDLVTYESASPGDLQGEFEAAVEDYIETCAQLGRAPQVPLKGQFNVRVPPPLHKAISLRACEDGVSLNDVVVRALNAFVCVRADVTHKVTLTLNVSEAHMQRVIASTSVQQWGAASVH